MIWSRFHRICKYIVLLFLKLYAGKKIWNISISILISYLQYSLSINSWIVVKISYIWRAKLHSSDLFTSEDFVYFMRSCRILKKKKVHIVTVLWHKIYHCNCHGNDCKKTSGWHHVVSFTNLVDRRVTKERIMKIITSLELLYECFQNKVNNMWFIYY